jgi:hypothetical protein
MHRPNFGWSSNARSLLVLPVVLLAAAAGLMMHSAAAQPPYSCATWNAWIDRMPGPGAVPTLHVQGQCTFQVVGYSVELKPHVPPAGADNGVFLLDLVVHQPAGPAVAGVGSASVSYATSVTGRYHAVMLLPDRIEIPVKQTF